MMTHPQQIHSLQQAPGSVGIALQLFFFAEPGFFDRVLKASLWLTNVWLETHAVQAEVKQQVAT